VVKAKEKGNPRNGQKTQKFIVVEHTKNAIGNRISYGVERAKRKDPQPLLVLLFGELAASMGVSGGGGLTSSGQKSF